jgi:hypothetical protein
MQIHHLNIQGITLNKVDPIFNNSGLKIIISNNVRTKIAETMNEIPWLPPTLSDFLDMEPYNDWT